MSSDQLRDPPSWIEEERNKPPYATVTQTGRWTWHIVVTDGLLEGEYRWVLGRKRAERRAQRLVRRCEQERRRKRASFTVELHEHANVSETHHSSRGGNTVRWMRLVGDYMGGPHAHS